MTPNSKWRCFSAIGVWLFWKAQEECSGPSNMSRKPWHPLQERCKWEVSELILLSSFPFFIWTSFKGPYSWCPEGLRKAFCRLGRLGVCGDVKAPWQVRGQSSQGAQRRREEVGGVHFLGETKSAILDARSSLVSSREVYGMVTFYSFHWAFLLKNAFAVEDKMS